MFTKRVIFSSYLKVTSAHFYRWVRQRMGLYRRGSGAADLDRIALPKDLTENRAWAKLSEASFARDWHNEKDAVYDNWRKLYGVAVGPKGRR